MVDLQFLTQKRPSRPKPVPFPGAAPWAVSYKTALIHVILPCSPWRKVTSLSSWPKRLISLGTNCISLPSPFRPIPTSGSFSCLCQEMPQPPRLFLGKNNPQWRSTRQIIPQQDSISRPLETTGIICGQINPLHWVLLGCEHPTASGWLCFSLFRARYRLRALPVKALRYLDYWYRICWTQN